MGKIPKDWIAVVGGGLASSCLVFGAGMYLLGSQPRATEAHAAAVQDDGKSPSVDGAQALALISQAEAAQARGKTDEARELYGRACKADPHNPKALLRCAAATFDSVTLPSQHRHEKALELYARFLSTFATHEDTATAQFRVGQCYLHLGRLDEALQTFVQHEQRFPASTRQQEAQVAAAECLDALGQPEAAVQRLETLLTKELKPELRSIVEVKLAQARLSLARQVPVKPAVSAPTAKELTPITRLIEPADAEVPAVSVRHDQQDAPQPQAWANMPDGQWLDVKRALEKGNLPEAKRLLAPWLTTPSPDANETAQHWLVFAKLLQNFAETRSNGEVAQPTASVVEEGAK